MRVWWTVSVDINNGGTTDDDDEETEDFPPRDVSTGNPQDVRIALISSNEGIWIVDVLLLGLNDDEDTEEIEVEEEGEGKEEEENELRDSIMNRRGRIPEERENTEFVRCPEISADPYVEDE